MQVSKWQEVWDKYQDLERRAKDPSRYQLKCIFVGMPDSFDKNISN